MKPACAVAIAVGHASLSAAAAAAAAWPAPIQALEQQGYEILGRFDGRPAWPATPRCAWAARKRCT